MAVICIALVYNRYMTLDKPTQQAPIALPQNETPKESRYTRFYLTMLILSTVGTALSLTELWAIQPSINELTTNPVNSIANLISVLLIFPVSIAALVLLWLKKPLGIWLKLSTYAATIIVTAANLFVVEQTLKGVIAQAIAEEAKRGADRLPDNLIAAIFTGAYYTGLAITITSCIVFGILWWFAWRKQAAADSDQQSASNT